MNNNLKIKTNIERLFRYIEDLERGNIQVPAFQRDFVWDNTNKLDLFDSIKKGYPIGTLLFWKPNFQSEKDLYTFELDKMGAYYIPAKTKDFYYILDGYQRLSTLFGCLLNPLTNMNRDKKEWEKEFNIIYNIEDDKFEFNKKTNFEDLEIYQIPVYRLIDGKEFYQFQKQLVKLNLEESKINDYIKKYEYISHIFQNYELPSINIIGGTITEAVDIFSRLNSKGAKISADWVVSALSFNKDRNFRLGTKIDELLEDLDRFNFKNLKRELVVQCISNSFGGIYFDTVSHKNHLEVLAKRDDFVDITEKTLKNIQKAVKFLFEELLVLDSKLLPYNSQLIFITDFFNQVKNPEPQLQDLKNWFWITAYSGYFTMYNLSKQRMAYNQFQSFIEDATNNPIYKDKPNQPFIVSEFPSKINFGSARATSLALFMLHYFNEFEPLNEENTEGYKTYNLFSDGMSSEEKNVSENTILLIEKYHGETNTPNIFNNLNLNIPKKAKNLSFWLGSEGNHDRLFITQEMKNRFRNGSSKEEILQMRKALIQKEEKAFVEKLGLEYIINN